MAHPKIEDFILFFIMWIIGSSIKNDGREGDVKPEESMRAGRASPLLYSSSRFDSAGGSID